ncbi:putative sodium hydrogen exchanger family protein [Rosellinia necatrix]|uniref:Putative sodium hydrogen exchanger family protein n=1 Tax=Rosellinia necatrix TaxID=77044 RepID=A0A1W2TS04_ROSNE|nr:putative sodium hydrogen exchanger family protein [Rosellinia necatrix]
MVRIITSLGQSGESGVKPETILRSVLVSVAFAIAVPIACRFVLKPGQKALDRVIKACDIKEGKTSEGESSLRSRLASWTRSKEAAFLVQTALLIILIVAADFAGASILLAAYLAGAVVSWWSERRDVCEISSPPQGTETNSEEPSTSADRQKGSNTRETESPSEGPLSHITEQEINMPQHTATVVFDSYYAHALNYILKPFFFVSPLGHRLVWE